MSASLLACSDCYAHSATSTFALYGVLGAAVVAGLLAALFIRRRRGRRLIPVGLAGLGAGALMLVSVLLPASQVAQWQSQPVGGPYRLVCGSAFHAALQVQTSAGDALEARDGTYCKATGAKRLHLGEAALASAALLALLSAIAAMRPRGPRFRGQPVGGTATA